MWLAWSVSSFISASVIVLKKAGQQCILQIGDNKLKRTVIESSEHWVEPQMNLNLGLHSHNAQQPRSQQNQLTIYQKNKLKSINKQKQSRKYQYLKICIKQKQLVLLSICTEKIKFQKLLNKNKKNKKLTEQTKFNSTWEKKMKWTRKCCEKQ